MEGVHVFVNRKRRADRNINPEPIKTSKDMEVELMSRWFFFPRHGTNNAHLSESSPMERMESGQQSGRKDAERGKR